jgi:hypothetical protein
MVTIKGLGLSVKLNAIPTPQRNQPLSQGVVLARYHPAGALGASAPRPIQGVAGTPVCARGRRPDKRPSSRRRKRV